RKCLRPVSDFCRNKASPSKQNFNAISTRGPITAPLGNYLTELRAKRQIKERLCRTIERISSQMTAITLKPSTSTALTTMRLRNAPSNWSTVVTLSCGSMLAGLRNLIANWNEGLGDDGVYTFARE